MFMSRVGRKAAGYHGLVLGRTNPVSMMATRMLSSETEEVDPKKAKKKREKAVQSKSLVMNIFRGAVETEQVFPFPQVMLYLSY
jgi:hypothetical protein